MAKREQDVEFVRDMVTEQESSRKNATETARLMHETTEVVEKLRGCSSRGQAMRQSTIGAVE